MSAVARLAVGLLAIGALVMASGPAAAQSVVDVSLLDNPYAVVGAPATVQEGTVTFQVTNDGPNLYHNFVVIKTDLPPDGLPCNDENCYSLVNEDDPRLEIIGKTRELANGDPEATVPGESDTLTVDLPPGNYVLICNNLDGHYGAGMYQGFQVTAAPRSPTPTFVPGQPTPTPPPADGTSATPAGTGAGGVPSVGSGPQEEKTENWWALAALAVAGAGLLGLGVLTHRWAQAQQRR